MQFLVGEAKRDARVVYYKFFTSYLKGRTLFDNDFSFKMVLNKCAETDRNRQTDLFEIHVKQRRGAGELPANP